MIRRRLLRRCSISRPLPPTSSRPTRIPSFNPIAPRHFSNYSTEDGSPGKWYELPTYTPSITPSSLGKELCGGSSSPGGDLTAVKWVLRCCPHLPRSLVQKLFRLRQVRREAFDGSGEPGSLQKLKRVGAKDAMNSGDRVVLPISIQELSDDKKPELRCSEEEVSFLNSLVVYKDPAIIVVNKPHGLPVQGGVGIRWSLDDLAAAYLKNEASEPPRLVHRLDRDSSGVMVMGRTQTSTTVLHSIFREKTISASESEIGDRKRVLQRKYWALVKGCPKRSKGLISATLGKVAVDDGRSERITIMKDAHDKPSQTAVTEYRVIKPSSHGYTWLELCPLTGRKHQLRIHCSMVLGTPIVGDYKYGWQAHLDWKPVSFSSLDMDLKDSQIEKKVPFGLSSEDGSISGEVPKLHLHCKQMVLPDVSLALQNLRLSSDFNISELESLEFSAPIPPHMQRSWDVLESSATT
uniref:Pseudouridine synthase RsuA/RluA-like domain-containing protein n=1 Tax=Kalanchoe fedtschenkoi TaxID=63787 RepID=A0A7N0T4T4_KALFE